MKMCTAAMALVIVGLKAGAVASADDPPQNVQEYFGRLYIEHRNQLAGTPVKINELNLQLRQVKTARVNATKGGTRENPTIVNSLRIYSSADEKAAAVQDAELQRELAVTRLVKLKSTEPPWRYGIHASMNEPASVGDIGRLSGAKIVQIIDDGNLIVTWGKEPVWITGMKTEGLTDSDSVGTSYLMIANGTKRYTTVLGAEKTVLHLEAFSESKLDDFAASYKPPAKRK